MGTVLENPPPGFIEVAPSAAAGPAPPSGFVETTAVPAPPVPIPQPLGMPQPSGRPRSIEEATGGLVTPGLATGLTGTVGTALGAGSGLLAGPGAVAASPVGAAVGGVLGAAAGRYGYEAVEDFLGRQGVLDRPPTTIADLGDIASEEAQMEALGLGLGALGRPLLASKKALGRILGVGTERAKALSEAAMRGGLVEEGRVGGRPMLGAADVGGNIARGTMKALSVFPFTGTPALRNLAKKEGAVFARVNSILDELAPNALLRNELGLELTNRAGQRFGAFKRYASRLSDNFDQLARNASRTDIIPTTTIKRQAQEFADAVSRGEVELLTGDRLSSPIKDRVMEYALDLTQLPGRISIDQYRQRVRDLAGLMDEIQTASGKGSQFTEAAQLKAALETDLLDIGLARTPGPQGGVTNLIPKEEADKLRGALDRFNQFYSRGMTDFETSTAGKFLRADRNMFRAGPPKGGTVTKDQLADLVANTNSPQALKELQAVVGQKAVRDAGRFYIDNALRLASEPREIAGQMVDVVDINQFMKGLGLEGTRRSNREGMQELFKTMGGDLGDFEALMTAARSIERSGDPATFVLRRTILGGIPAMAGAAGAGAAAASGAMDPTTIAALTYVFRRASDLVSSPKAMESMKQALDQSIAPSARRQALSRVIVSLARDAAGPEEEQPQARRIRRGLAGAPPTAESQPSRLRRLSR